MKQLKLSLAMAGVAVMATLGTAHAQQSTCAARDIVVERLGAAYGETRQSLGLGANNSLVEVFASDETGTWTITVTMPDGKTCLIASGKAFEQLVGEKLAMKGSDI